ncbi:MAG TPA: hypothetical protein DCW57_05880 [Planctomycetaceae bacterium]|nr:hypothetical protein [Planctomycetaceae bacterium]
MTSFSYSFPDQLWYESQKTKRPRVNEILPAGAVKSKYGWNVHFISPCFLGGFEKFLCSD